MKKYYIRPFAEDMRFGSLELCMEKDSFHDGGGGSGGEDDPVRPTPR